jgi:anti-anti-sigma factor
MAEASVSCYTRRDGRIPVLVLEGTLDLSTAPGALEAIHRFLEEHGPEVTLDAARLDFIDSKGVGALLSAAKAARDAGGTLYLQSPATPVRKILETCGLTTLFPSPALRPTPAAAPATAAPPAASRAAAATARPLRRAA